MELLSVFIPVFVVVFAMLSGVVILLGLAWLGSRMIRLVQVKIDNEELGGAVARLDDLVATAVAETEQTAGSDGPRVATVG
jgi:hypothetical protein